MLEKFNMRLLGGAFVIIVLLCAGLYFYTVTRQAIKEMAS